jgi:hypothetical protein
MSDPRLQVAIFFTGLRVRMSQYKNPAVDSGLVLVPCAARIAISVENPTPFASTSIRERARRDTE